LDQASGAAAEVWLTQELGGRDATMFVDETSIEMGAHWPAKIQQALQRSRCMVCVSSPQYFQSDWCFSEWSSFREREKQLRSHLMR
jgi:hypothetical protein